MSFGTLKHFDEFFKAVYGVKPFPWQRRVAKRALKGTWPQGMALPTASGKTAMIDIAVFVMAARVEAEKENLFRRIFFTIDRRIVVDQAFCHAVRLARKLMEAKSGILCEVADRLREFGGLEKDAQPLTCHELRGGIGRDNTWARNPAQPMVVATTVDQIGSRLFHRGYGLSVSIRPIHAGLVANDSLVLLDEAHCSEPFRQSLEAVARFRDWGDDNPRPGFHFVQMSATLPRGIDDTMRLDEDDCADPELGRRLAATKTAKLVIANRAKGKKATAVLAKCLAGQVAEKIEQGARRVGVVVNRVATARAVCDLLETERRKYQSAETFLLTGRMRPIDRDDVAKQVDEAVGASKTRPARETPVVVVSTQCIEVGADFDFDAMVCECASLDAIRQRFGRLNRLGLVDDAQAVIIIREDQATKPDPDPVYGDALRETWDWLGSIAEDGIVSMDAQSLDRVLGKLKEEERVSLLSRLNAPTPDAPIMLPAYLDFWCQTSPEPTPDPDVSLFLHGRRRNSPDVYVLWRADFEPGEVSTKEEAKGPLADAWSKTVALCPPRQGELMPVPIHVFRDWLAGGSEVDQSLDDTEDFEPTQNTRPRNAPENVNRLGLRWKGLDESTLVSSPSDVSHGDVIVLPESSEDSDRLGFIPAERTNPRDCAEPVQIPGRTHFLRLHPVLLRIWLSDDEAIGKIRAFLEPGRMEEEFAVEELLAALSEVSAELAAGCPIGEFLNEIDTAEVQFEYYPPEPGREHPPGIVLRKTVTKKRETKKHVVQVPLGEHLAEVGKTAEQFAIRCGMPPELASDLKLAAELHDLGKADKRFQGWLRNCPALLAGGEPMAHFRQARSVRPRMYSDYPKGARHEVMSLRLIESDADAVLNEAHDADLVLHLVGSHHGRCRPFAPVADGEPVEIEFKWRDRLLRVDDDRQMGRLDTGIPERFWRLVRRYGWWGLAWIEAVFRLADHRQSEIEETQEPDCSGAVNHEI